VNYLKNTELKLLAALMKNSKASDRDLAKILGVSQPTITRTRARLEKEGYIREYTIIPDFQKLGYEILSLSFVTLKKGLSEEEIEKARNITSEDLRKNPYAVLMLERGSGMGYTGVVMALHRDYRSYCSHLNRLRGFTFLEISKLNSFLISLKEEIHYRPLTFLAFAADLLRTKEEKE
jgi:DNA-binding Lrp family transcriptional regulator